MGGQLPDAWSGVTVERRSDGRLTHHDVELRWSEEVEQWTFDLDYCRHGGCTFYGSIPGLVERDCEPLIVAPPYRVTFEAPGLEPRVFDVAGRSLTEEVVCLWEDLCLRVSIDPPGMS